jgi:hypothetical protein
MFLDLTLDLVIATSEVQNTRPSFSWLGLEILIVLSVTLSSAGSFLLASQFHRAFQIAQGGEPKKDWSIRLAFILFIVHSVLFALFSILNGTVTHGFGPVAQLASVAFVLFRAYISAYFFWGHWQVYKLFKVADKSKSEGDAEHIGRRLGLISSFNLICVLLGALFNSTSISQYHHGWIIMMLLMIVMGLTYCLEIKAVPLAHSRQDSLKGSKHLSKSRSASPKVTRIVKWFSTSHSDH